jgi:DNA-directed RNA polymerase subunit K/omega
MPIETLNVELFEEKCENLYESIVVMAKRARQINEEERAKQALEMNTDLLSEEEDILEDSEKIRQAFEFSKEIKIKPTRVALQEMAEGQIGYEYLEEKE